MRSAALLVVCGALARSNLAATVTVENESALLVFKGQWTGVKGESYSGGATSFAADGGASVSFTITGTSSIDWISAFSPGAASGLVTLDDGSPKSVNCSRPTSASKALALTIPVPDANQHKLTIAYDPKSSKGSHLDVDAFKLTGSAPSVLRVDAAEPPKPSANEAVNTGMSVTGATSNSFASVLVDETSPLINYVGTWASANDPKSIGGGVAFAASAGSRASFAAPLGVTSIAWMTSFSPGAGTVSVDGGSATVVNCAKPDQRGVLGFNATGLDPATKHVMTVEYSASSPAASHLDIDGFIFVTTDPAALASLSAGTSAPAAGPEAAEPAAETIDDQGPGLIRIDDSNQLLRYAGNWQRVASTGSVGGGVRFASAVGAFVTLKDLKGVSQISWFTSVSPGAAVAEITVDDQPAVTVNCSRPSSLSHQLGYSASNLDPTQLHTITVTYAESSFPTAHLDIDDFEITTDQTIQTLIGTPAAGTSSSPASSSDGSATFIPSDSSTAPVQTVPGSASLCSSPAFLSSLALALVAVASVMGQ